MGSDNCVAARSDGKCTVQDGLKLGGQCTRGPVAGCAKRPRSPAELPAFQKHSATQL
jgi:hypothetical protein